MLLDTHALLWFLADDPRLPSSLRSLIEDSDRVFASVVSLWEIAIKLSINKLTLKFEFQDLPNFLDELEINVRLQLCLVENAIIFCMGANPKPDDFAFLGFHDS